MKPGRVLAACAAFLLALAAWGASPTGGQGRLPQINVKDFGAVGNGSADDTAALQAAFTAAIATPYGGRGVYIPAGTYKVTSTITLTRPVGVVISGAGKWATALSWSGSAGIPMFLMYNSREVVLENMRFIGDTSAKPSYIIEVRGDSTDPLMGQYSPTGNIFRNLNVGNGCTTAVGYTLAAGSADANNDAGHFTNVSFANCDVAGFYNQHLNGKLHRFEACTFMYLKRGIWMANGSFSAHGNYFANVMSGTDDANIYIDATSDTCSLYDNNSEQSKRFVYMSTANGANTSPLNIVNNRVVQDAAAAVNDIISVTDTGPYVVKGNFFQALNASRAIGVKLTTASYGAATVEDNAWFYAGTQTSTAGFPILTYSGAGQIDFKRARNIYHSSSQGVASLDGYYTEGTSTVSYTVTPDMNGWLVGANRSGGSELITLPGNAPPGFTITIKDTQGDAGTSAVVAVPGSIQLNGSAANASVITTPYGSSTITFDGAKWWTVGSLRNPNSTNALSGSLTLVSAIPSSATSTVYAGSKCVCTNATTQANPVKCAVSGSVLTATGPNSVTDSVTYFCF